METDFSESMTQLQTDLDNAVAKMNQEDTAYESGVNTIQGYINGSEDMRDDLITQFTSLANAATAAYNAAQKIESPSKEFRQSGRHSIQGAVLGAEDERPKLIRTYGELGRSTLSAYDEALEDSVSAGHRMADVYNVVNARSADIGRTYRSGTAEIAFGGNAGRSFTDEDLRKLAKEYGDITAAYWSDMKYVFDNRELGRMMRKVQ